MIEMTPLIGRPARWLTNTDRRGAEGVADTLRRGSARRDIVIGYPRATEQHSADDLHCMGLVGLYDATHAEE